MAKKKATKKPKPAKRTVRSGSKPKPARKKAATSRRETAAESKPDRNSPPDWLGPVAVEHWHRVLPVVKKRGLFTDLDADILAVYCDCWQQLHEATAQLACDGGEYQTTDKGYIYLHPAVSRRDKALDRMRKVQEQLGLTPAARRSLKVSKEESDPLEAFLSERRD